VLTLLDHSKETVKYTCGKSSGFFKVPSTKCNNIKHIKHLELWKWITIITSLFQPTVFSRLIYSRYFTTISCQKEKSGAQYNLIVWCLQHLSA